VLTPVGTARARDHELVGPAAIAGQRADGISPDIGETVVSIQSRRFIVEEDAAMQVIGAALGNNFDLRAGIPPIFGGVRTCRDIDLFDRLLAGSDNRRATPGKTVDVHAVNFEIVAEVRWPLAEICTRFLALIDGGV